MCCNAAAGPFLLVLVALLLNVSSLTWAGLNTPDIDSRLYLGPPDVDKTWVINENIVNFWRPESERGGKVPANVISQPAVLVNNSWPGPGLDVYVGDIIRIQVINNLLTDVVTIHWHGIGQRESPWADGSDMVSQCPIEPGGGQYTYMFKPDHPGTFFWHAHTGVQMDLGLVGHLIVRPRPGGADAPDPHIGLYDHDNLPGIIVQDWWRDPLSMLKAPNFLNFQNFEGALINGFFAPVTSATASVIPPAPGSDKLTTWTFPSKATTPDSSNISTATGLTSSYEPSSMLLPPLTTDTRWWSAGADGGGAWTPYVMSLENGKCYRLRFINANAEAVGWQVAVVNHTLTLIAHDAQPLEPQPVASFVFYAGNRVDAVLCADHQGGGEFPLVFSSVSQLSGPCPWWPNKCQFHVQGVIKYPPAATVTNPNPNPNPTHQADVPTTTTPTRPTSVTASNNSVAASSTLPMPSNSSLQAVSGATSTEGSGAQQAPAAVDITGLSAGDGENMQVKNVQAVVDAQRSSAGWMPLGGRPCTPQPTRSLTVQLGFLSQSGPAGTKAFLYTKHTPWAMPLSPVLLTGLECGARPDSHVEHVTDESEVVEVVINNLTDLPHPVHLHGGTFTVMGVGWFTEAQWQGDIETAQNSSSNSRGSNTLAQNTTISTGAAGQNVQGFCPEGDVAVHADATWLTKANNKVAYRRFWGCTFGNTTAQRAAWSAEAEAMLNLSSSNSSHNNSPVSQSSSSTSWGPTGFVIQPNNNSSSDGDNRVSSRRQGRTACPVDAPDVGLYETDTVLLPARTWAVIRIHKWNPGLWQLHCHTIHHVMRGMGFMFNVLPDRRPPVPDWIYPINATREECDAWEANGFSCANMCGAPCKHRATPLLRNLSDNNWAMLSDAQLAATNHAAMTYSQYLALQSSMKNNGSNNNNSIAGDLLNGGLKPSGKADAGGNAVSKSGNDNGVSDGVDSGLLLGVVLGLGIPSFILIIVGSVMLYMSRREIRNLLEKSQVQMFRDSKSQVDLESEKKRLLDTSNMPSTAVNDSVNDISTMSDGQHNISVTALPTYNSIKGHYNGSSNSLDETPALYEMRGASKPSSYVPLSDILKRMMSRQLSINTPQPSPPASARDAPDSVNNSKDAECVHVSSEEGHQRSRPHTQDGSSIGSVEVKVTSDTSG